MEVNPDNISYSSSSSPEITPVSSRKSIDSSKKIESPVKQKEEKKIDQAAKRPLGQSAEDAKKVNDQKDEINAGPGRERMGVASAVRKSRMPLGRVSSLHIPKTEKELEGSPLLMHAAIKIRPASAQLSRPSVLDESVFTKSPAVEIATGKKDSPRATAPSAAVTRGVADVVPDSASKAEANENLRKLFQTVSEPGLGLKMPKLRKECAAEIMKMMIDGMMGVDKNELGEGPSYQKYVDTINQLTSFVAISIMSERDDKKRGALYKFFGDVMKVSAKNGDLTGCWAIASALNKPQVANSLKMAPQDIQEAIGDVDITTRKFLPEKNFKVLRGWMDQLRSSAKLKTVPPILYTKDMETAGMAIKKANESLVNLTVANDNNAAANPMQIIQQANASINEQKENFGRDQSDSTRSFAAKVKPKLGLSHLMEDYPKGGETLDKKLQEQLEIIRGEK